MPVKVRCSVPNCQFETDEVSETLAIALLGNHALAHQIPAPAGGTGTTSNIPRGPKLERPRVDIGVSTEGWNVFTRRWQVFRSGSGIDEASAPSQLFQCAGPELGDSLLKANPHITSASLQDLLAAMRSLAVIPVATGVLRADLLQVRQEREEPFRAFAARVRGKAETCEFEAACECGKSVDYTDNQVRDVLLNGINDPDIRREVLGTKNILKTPVNDVIAFVENKEMARNTLPSPSFSAISSSLRQQIPPLATTPAGPSRADRAVCPDCRASFHVYTEGARGWNSKPHQVCITCFGAHRRTRRNNHPPQASQPAVQAVETEPISQIAALHHERSAADPQHKPPAIALDHHVFTKGEWRRARLRDHPTVPITVSLDTTRNSSRPVHAPSAQAEVLAIADTGAQLDLWSLAEFLACGFSLEDLVPVRLGLTAANRSPITIEGAFFAQLSTTNRNGATSTCRSMIYVSNSVKCMYLSYESMLNLGILSYAFPYAQRQDSDRAIGDSTAQHKPPSVHSTDAANGSCSDPDTTESTCSCPQRTPAPPHPSALPFECTPENNMKMRAWLLERYASSSFNTCPHRSLPCMEGPPVEIHVDPNAKPRTCHTPATIPLHWQQQVHNDLLRDEALGVIERVPYGEPTTWCHRMVVTRKHDGSPRRTVDLSPLNKFCQRETFAMESPFHLARRVPIDNWKTVTVAKRADT